jgi:hypothetical protein
MSHSLSRLAANNLAGKQLANCWLKVTGCVRIRD